VNPKRLKINGFSIPILEDGRFESKVPLGKSSVTDVVIQVQDLAENRDAFSFQLCKDLKAPSASLQQPKDGKAWGQPGKTLKIGFSEPVRNVTIDGKHAQRGADDLYFIHKELSQGDNPIIVKATDIAGNVMNATFKVRYGRHNPQKLKAEKREWSSLNQTMKRRGNLKNKLSALKRFIANHPDGYHTPEAKEILRQMNDKIEMEKSAYRSACKAAKAASSPQGKIRILGRYIEKHQDSHCIDDARVALQSILDKAIPLKIDGVQLADSPGTFLNAKDKSPMVYIPPSSFKMGRDGGAPEDGPQVSCRLSGYYMYVHEVTNNQYAAFLNAHGKNSDSQGSPLVYDSVKEKSGRFPWGLTQDSGRWKPVKGFENHPVIFVSWFGAQAYANWAGAVLPTEAQWERAAQNADGSAYPWGDNPPDEEHANLGKKLGKTVQVGTCKKGITSSGCFDMAGNVYEWCRDAFSPQFLKLRVQNRKDPYNPGKGDKSLRGGSWFHGEKFAETTCRQISLNPSGHFPTTGFRCVIEKRK
jgi:formylglycine-generating enzyme required for sulfatase activity